jgi:hypothetical protein
LTDKAVDEETRNILAVVLNWGRSVEGSQCLDGSAN